MVFLKTILLFNFVDDEKRLKKIKQFNQFIFIII